MALNSDQDSTSSPPPTPTSASPCADKGGDSAVDFEMPNGASNQEDSTQLWSLAQVHVDLTQAVSVMLLVHTYADLCFRRIALQKMEWLCVDLHFMENGLEIGLDWGLH